MTDANEPGYEKPVVTDKRRIDPETGKAREPRTAGASHDAPAGPAGTGQPAGSAEAPDARGPADDAADPGSAGGTTQAGQDELVTAQAEALDLADQLARRNAELYNVQQEYNAYVRRSKGDAAAHRQAGVQEVVEALLGVLDEIELARRHGDLAGPFAAIAEKLEGTLAQRFEVTRYGSVGEEFDPARHEALMHATDPDADATRVTQVLQPGYRAGERVIRAARVAVSSPE